MMILTVDIGNSRIKAASWSGEAIVERAAVMCTPENCVQAFDELFDAVEKPEQIFAACVAGDKLSRGLSEWCRQHWQLDVSFLKTEKQFNGITNAYPIPSQHGVDRWAAIVAGHQIFSGFSICVINAGTALVFDLVNKDGRHLGGYILPSYVTMHNALLADTNDVEAEHGIQLCKQEVPDNTSDAVNQGLHKFIQAGVREMCRFAETELDEPVKIILTGGFAEIILDYPDMPIMIHQPDLVMQGLYHIMKQQKG